MYRGKPHSCKTMNKYINIILDSFQQLRQFWRRCGTVIDEELNFSHLFPSDPNSIFDCLPPADPLQALITSIFTVSSYFPRNSRLNPSSFFSRNFRHYHSLLFSHVSTFS